MAGTGYPLRIGISLHICLEVTKSSDASRLQTTARQQAEEKKEQGRAQDAYLEAFQQRLQASMEEELQYSNGETWLAEATMAPDGGVEQCAEQIPGMSYRLLTDTFHGAKRRLKPSTSSHE